MIKGKILGKKKITLKNPEAKIFLKTKYEKNKDIGKITKQLIKEYAAEDKNICLVSASVLNFMNNVSKL